MRVLLVGLLLAGATGLQAAEITVLSSNALKSVLEELVPQFEKATGHKVTAGFAPAAELKARIEKGEAFDVAILTAALMDELARDKRVAGISRTSVAKAGAELVGPLPPEVQVYTVFAAATSSSAREPAAAYAFVRFLKTQEAAKVIREKGMEPG